MKSPARAALPALLALAIAGCAGTDRHLVADTPVKVGRPYQVAGRTYYPTDDRNYEEVGIASWYGRDQRGRTANGETFDGRRGGAAHKTLPLPCYVEVTALATGRRIIVRVNDRGPFLAGRIIDLSYVSAQMLGITRAGTARVRVRRVFPDEATRRALRKGEPAALLSNVPTAALDRADPLALSEPLGYHPDERSPPERTTPIP